MMLNTLTFDKIKNLKNSRSESEGLELVTRDIRNVLSIGISTAGVAEVKMLLLNPDLHIIANTIDEKGLEFAKTQIKILRLDDNIECKLEDISKVPLNYQDNSVDYIYARLVLHYLSKQKLDSTLLELYRILKPGSNIYIVVRSDKCEDAIMNRGTYNDGTGLTTMDYYNTSNTNQRYFHNTDTISKHLQRAGFIIEKIQEFEEQLFIDFERKNLSDKKDILISVVATK